MTAPVPALGFRLVLADPPWLFETWSAKGQGRSPQRHYACMTDDEIRGLWFRLDLDRTLADDCVLVLWATWPKLPAALSVLEYWGFRYATGRTWLKTTAAGEPARGTGLLLPGADEPFLVGKRGSPRARRRGGRVAGDLLELPVLTDTRRQHSRKPDSMYRLCETLFHGPALELFARGAPRPGWTLWGDQVGAFGEEA